MHVQLDKKLITLSSYNRLTRPPNITATTSTGSSRRHDHQAIAA